MADKEYKSFYNDDLGQEPVIDDFTVPPDTEMTPDLLSELISQHERNKVPRYLRLQAAYETKYQIFDKNKYKKPDYKPDNRLAADFAKYIQDTFEGYYIGVPPDIKMAEESQQEWLDNYLKENNQEDVDADLSDYCSEYGQAVELLYQDPNGNARSVALTPRGAFIVYDDSVDKNKLFGVRYFYDNEGELHGTWSDDTTVHTFSAQSQYQDEFVETHVFGEVPMIQYRQNKEQRGIFEGVLNLIEAYNKALSEKANDIDYFADAYLVIAGTELDEDKMKEDLRSYRLINLWTDAEGVNVDAHFLAKPEADGTQENFINRLEDLIYKLAMVPDISDTAFGTASGIALRMRLLPMSNLARKKDRKFVAAMRERFRLLANYPNQPFTDWQDVEITMKRNMPEDIESEASAAAALAGIVSQETQLSVLSFIEDPNAEIERMKQEKEEAAAALMEQTGGNRAPKKEATMYQITSVLGQHKRGVLTYSNALEMLLYMGLDEEKARQLLDSKDEETTK